MCVPGVRPRATTSNEVPPAGATIAPSTDQSTLITSGSITLTVSMRCDVTAPGCGVTLSMGKTCLQMSTMIFSREMALNDVLGLSPNNEFIIELPDER